MPDPAPPASTFPFGLFGAAQPQLAHGLTTGVDMMKKMLGQVPGASAIPGFLLPTVDTDELDKRIADLRAAESWLDVNLNLLRATIQGLEVQRNTIAAIRSFGSIGSVAPAGASPSAPPTTTLPPGWPAPAVEPPPAPARVEPPAQEASLVGPATAEEPEPKPAASTADPLVSMAAGNWLGFMQDQFAKVASAALAGGASPTPAPRAKAAAPAKQTARKRRTKRA